MLVERRERSDLQPPQNATFKEIPPYPPPVPSPTPPNPSAFHNPHPPGRSHIILKKIPFIETTLFRGERDGWDGLLVGFWEENTLQGAEPRGVAFMNDGKGWLRGQEGSEFGSEMGGRGSEQHEDLLVEGRGPLRLLM